MLYIVGTPIGNLKDLSERQVDVIAHTSVLLSEDTRSTQKLLAHIASTRNTLIQPEQRIISYYREREFEKLPEIITLLREGTDVALLSEAGMPVISDPGYLLVKTAIQERISLTVIPGPNAAVDAIILSGFKFEQFMFLGFLPKKENQLTRLIDKSIQIKKSMKDTIFVAYESPERIQKTLSVLNEICPDADVAVCREMTKKFEEVVRGKPGELAKRSYKGEITLVMEFA